MRKLAARSALRVVPPQGFLRRHGLVFAGVGAAEHITRELGKRLGAGRDLLS